MCVRCPWGIICSCSPDDSCSKVFKSLRGVQNIQCIRGHPILVPCDVSPARPVVWPGRTLTLGPSSPSSLVTPRQHPPPCPVCQFYGKINAIKANPREAGAGQSDRVSERRRWYDIDTLRPHSACGDPTYLYWKSLTRQCKGRARRGTSASKFLMRAASLVWCNDVCYCLLLYLQIRA